MYEDYSRQALPSKRYRELLGSAICVFNSNNQFIIENILKIDASNYTWYSLIDMQSGNLKGPIKSTITEKHDAEVANLFEEIVAKRNRIVHSFQVTENGDQVLRTKEKKGGEQFTITEDYLLKFIENNQALSDLLYDVRDKEKA